MRVFQEEIFGPMAAVMTFKDEEHALELANDTEFGLGAGVWTNCYNLYPAHAVFGGYKKSCIGRENHKMALAAYQQTKCLLVSYSQNALGFF